MCLSNHFKVKRNVPLARQKLLASKPNPGEMIINFVMRLKSLAEHCNYGEEEDNQVRDIVISHVTNKELKSKINSTAKKILVFPNYWKSSAPISIKMPWFLLAKTL